MSDLFNQPEVKRYWRPSTKPSTGKLAKKANPKAMR
jgi:hypothetical protein